MTENPTISSPKPLSNHIQDLYYIIRTTVILVAILSILWSMASTALLTEWTNQFSFYEGTNNLAIYSPFEWVEVKWSFSILMSMTTVIPMTSILIFRFAKPGLYPHEYKWLRAILFVNSIILPLLIFIIWFWFVPEMANNVTSLSQLDNVSPRYDVAELTKLAMGITWVTIVSAFLINALSIIRFTNGEIGFYSWSRPRLIIIFLGLLVITLPSTFDGLRIFISTSIIIFCDFLSRLVPLSTNDN